MKTAVARLSGDADLRLRARSPVRAFSSADILEGDATFTNQVRLERGDLTFANPVAIEPQVNLQATTARSQLRSGRHRDWHASRLNINYRLEPPLPNPTSSALLALAAPARSRSNCSSSRARVCLQTKPPT